MFGYIVSGRFPQTNAKQVTDTNFVFSIEKAGSVGHIVVFMTGTTPLPKEAGAGVYLSWTGGQEWNFLGFNCLPVVDDVIRIYF